MNEDIKNLLESCYKIWSSEDWDESRAQSLVEYAAELYRKQVLGELTTEIQNNSLLCPISSV